ncbi:6-phosphofructo-2-kinase [Aureococcus anophagefferens]|nr:6-phosphofructo-2-kinase [Aureococcus anophagefferens]
MVYISGVKDAFGCDPFPQMLQNAHYANTPPPPPSAGRRMAGELASLDVPPAVFAALEAQNITSVALVARLAAADYERMGVPPRHRDALSEASKRLQGANGASGAESWEAAPARRAAPKPGSAPRPLRGAAAGFIFLCDHKTRGEVFQRRLFGLPPNNLKDMHKIGPSTALFLYDFRQRELMGPMKALRFLPLDSGATNLRNGVATLAIDKPKHGPVGAGDLSPARTKQLLDFLLG